jgi:hypothetical protein
VDDGVTLLIVDGAVLTEQHLEEPATRVGRARAQTSTSLLSTAPVLSSS